MGCFRALGCLVAAIVLACAAFVFRAQWLPVVHRAVSGVLASSGSSSTPAARWEPISAEGSSRARDAIDKLGARSGPVFANLSPGDLASYVFDALTRALPPSASNVEAAAIGDQLAIRADVRPADFGGRAAFGPLGNMFGDREPVQFAGTLEIVHVGQAEFRVTSLRIKDLAIPSAMVPSLLRNVARGRRPAGLAPNALALPVPDFIGDVRVHDDKITLYKTIP
jgi:hypothetical protein